MAVKLSRYVFRKIRGRIIPIRAGLERASKSANKIVDKLNKHNKTMNEVGFASSRTRSAIRSKSLKSQGIKRLGSGVDFTTFKRKGSYDLIIKRLKKWGGKTTRGTSNPKITKAHPELGDKMAVHKALGDNLPNYGVPTEPSEIIRLKKGERGILQNFVNFKKGKGKGFNWLDRERGKIARDTGLNIDAHYGNVANSRLIDTGGNLLKSRTNLDDAGKEILGIDNWYGTNIKEVYKKSTVMSDQALISGQSKKILNKINKMRKQGYSFKKSGSNEFKLVFKGKRIKSIESHLKPTKAMRANKVLDQMQKKERRLLGKIRSSSNIEEKKELFNRISKSQKRSKNIYKISIGK